MLSLKIHGIFSFQLTCSDVKKYCSWIGKFCLDFVHIYKSLFLSVLNLFLIINTFRIEKLKHAHKLFTWKVLAFICFSHKILLQKNLKELLYKFINISFFPYALQMKQSITWVEMYKKGQNSLGWDTNFSLFLPEILVLFLILITASRGVYRIIEKIILFCWIIVSLMKHARAEIGSQQNVFLCC